MRQFVMALMAMLPAVPLSGQEFFEIPSEGEVGYLDLSPLRTYTLLPDEEVPDLLLLHGAQAIPVFVTTDLIADENGRIGGIISLSWIDDEDISRHLELPATGRIRMRFRSSATLSIVSPSAFHYEWDHSLDVRASGAGTTIRIVGSSNGESTIDPTLSREWTYDLTSMVRGLGEASARARVLFGTEAVAKFATSQGVFGAENTQLRHWSGDAPFMAPGGEPLPGGSMMMDTRYRDSNTDLPGDFVLRAQNGLARTVVSGWTAATYEETALDVATGAFDFGTFGLMPTNRLFATPAFTTHERFEWDEDFWDRGQMSPPILDR